MMNISLEEMKNSFELLGWFCDQDWATISAFIIDEFCFEFTLAVKC